MKLFTISRRQQKPRSRTNDTRDASRVASKGKPLNSFSFDALPNDCCVYRDSQRFACALLATTMNQPHTTQTESKRSKASADSCEPDAFEAGAPDAFEYVLVEYDGEPAVWELCVRDSHRCARVGDEFHCIDCDLIKPIPDDGAQSSMSGWDDD